MKKAYAIGHIKIKEPMKWEEYRSKVPETLLPYKAELVFRGKLFEALSGAHDFTDTVVIRFPCLQDLNDWHNSTAYQQLVALRKQAADVTLLSFEE